MSPSRHVGPYQLIERLGRGGMGEVWLAEDVTGAAGGAPRRVALKLLDPGLVDDGDARARFAREIAAGRRIDSPFVARLLDADPDAEQPWLASAFVAGPTLEEHVARHGPLPAGALRALGVALAEALVATHGAGVVHRDLTPRNIVLGPDGPRVVDFGIAWFADAPEITQVGGWVGTPAWMAPERLAGGEVSVAGDVWSWGAVMAFAARGRQSTAGGGARAAAQRAAWGHIDVDGVPEWLDAIVAAAMADDPAARPTAAELHAAMTSGPAPVPPTVRADPPPTRVEAQDASTVPPADTTGVQGGADRTAVGRRTQHHRPSRWVRWASGVLVVAVAAAVAFVADLLLTVILVAVLLIVAVAMGLARESRPEGAKPVPPIWAFAVAAPVALGVGLAQVVGPIGGAAAVLALIVVFFLVGGDIG